MPAFIHRLLPPAFCTALLALVPAASAARHRPAEAPETEHAVYRGAIVIDAATGKILFEEHPDVQNPPASVTKLLTFAVIADKLRSGALTLQTPVTVSAAASHIGGSRVYLKQGETFTVDDLLYALMVQSANDAAYALAERAAGSRDAFVELMNAKARALGMTHSEFHSPHGLSPGRGQLPDLSTARDLATLSRWLLQNTDILRYTSTRIRDFRPGPHHILMTTHDHLLASIPGCDGLKTGWYYKAGYSIATTVQRNGRRIIVVVLGCPQRKERDAFVTDLIDRGFAALPPLPASAIAAVPTPTAMAAPSPSTGTAMTGNPVAPADASQSDLRPMPLTSADKQALGPAGNSGPAVHIEFSNPK